MSTQPGPPVGPPPVVYGPLPTDVTLVFREASVHVTNAVTGACTITATVRFPDGRTAPVSWTATLGGVITPPANPTGNPTPIPRGR